MDKDEIGDILYYRAEFFLALTECILSLLAGSNIDYDPGNRLR